MNKKSNKKTMVGLIVLIILIIISITYSDFLDNFKEGMKFLGISFLISAGLVLFLFGVKYIVKIMDKLLGKGSTFNKRVMIVFSVLILMSLTCGGFLYNLKLGMLFLIVAILFSSVILISIISLKARVNIFKVRARLENLDKKEAIRIFGMVFVCILVGISLSGTWAYFTNGKEIALDIVPLKVNYYGKYGSLSGKPSEGTTGDTSEYNNNVVNSLYEPQVGDVVIHFLNEYNGVKNSPFQSPYIYVCYEDSSGNKIEPAGALSVDYDEKDETKTGNQGTKMAREDNRYCWYSYIIRSPKSKDNTVSCIIKCPTYASAKFKIEELEDESYINEFIYGNEKNIERVDKTEDINLTYSEDEITHYYIVCKNIKSTQAIYDDYGSYFRGATAIYGIEVSNSNSSYDKIFKKSN